MFFIDSITFVLDKLLAAANAEAQDDAGLRDRLLEAQMQLDLGEITEEAFVEIERDVIARIREIKGQAHGPLTMSPDDRITGVEVESFDGEGSE